MKFWYVERLVQKQFPSCLRFCTTYCMMMCIVSDIIVYCHYKSQYKYAHIEYHNQCS